MFRLLQISALMAIFLIVANDSEAGHAGSAGNKTPVHGPGSSHDPRGPNYPTRTYPREYHSWGQRYWNSSYGCEYCWSAQDRCYFYYYAPARCYYPVTYIELFLPVQVGVTPAPAVAAKAVAPAVQTPR